MGCEGMQLIDLRISDCQVWVNLNWALVKSQQRFLNWVKILPVDLTSFLSRQNKDMITIYLENDIRSQHGHNSHPKHVFYF